MHVQTLRIPLPLRDALDAAARRGLRSRTSQIIAYVRQGLIADGLLSDDPTRDDRPRSPRESP